MATSVLSTVHKLADFFVNKRNITFVIPTFQRIYLWTHKECKALWLDILRAAETGQSHYLDSVSRFKQDTSREYITDGQQRMVSVMLLGLAILHALRNKKIKIKNAKNREFYKNCAEDMVYSRPLDMNGKKTLKIALNRNDLTVIQEVEKNPDAVEENVSPDILAENHIYDNYKFFRKEVERFLVKNGDLTKIFEAINNMEITVEDCPISKAQIVYSNKNSKGLPMTQVDLVKNTLMYMFPLEKQPEIHDKYWLKIEENVCRCNMEEFIIDAMAVINAMAKTIKVSFAWDEKCNLMQNVYDYMTRMHQGKNQTGASVRPEDSDNLMPKESEKILTALLDMSAIYHKYVTGVKTYETAATDALTEKVYQFERILGGQKGMSVILLLLKKYEMNSIKRNTVLSCMDAMITFQMRNKFVGQFKGVQRKPCIALMRAMNNVSNGQMDDYLWETLVNKSGTQGIASDKSLLEYFTNSQLSSGFGNTAKSQKDTTRFLLWKINNIYAKETHKQTVKYDENSLCVEHIIPPNNKAVWERELGETSEEKMKGIVDRLGNHALTHKRCDNDAFSEKRKVYTKLPFALTRLIGKMRNYTEAEVNKMTAVYAEYFIKAFPIPAKYNKDATTQKAA